MLSEGVELVDAAALGDCLFFEREPLGIVSLGWASSKLLNNLVVVACVLISPSPDPYSSFSTRRVTRWSHIIRVGERVMN